MKFEIKELDIKRDERGEVIEIIKSFDKTYVVKEVLFITSKPGVTRGNHYHNSKGEWLGIIKGKARFVYEDNKTGEREEVIISGEKPMIIKTPPDVTHAVQNIGEGELCMIELSNQLYDENPDTFKKQII